MRINGTRLRSEVILAVIVAAGCTAQQPYEVGTPYVNAGRASKGLVVVLPGIGGEKQESEDMRSGLDKADIPYALLIYRWGSGSLLTDQTDVARNRKQGEAIASQIVIYQHKHPGKPIFLVGHSAGSGIAVFTLEALGRIAGARPTDGAFLLSSSVSANYDLTDALKMTHRGIVNVSNSDDTFLLGTGTRTFGNVDGGHGDSAGRTGFSRPYAKVYERPMTNEEIKRRLGVTGSAHFVTTNEKLIETYAPAWLKARYWPIPPQR